MLDAILRLKSDFVCEALDLAAVHSAWTFNYLEDGQHDRAIGAFRRLVTAVREAASEMKEIEAEMSARKLTGDAAVAWRRDRDARTGRQNGDLKRVRPIGEPSQEKSCRSGDSTSAVEAA